MKKLIKTFLLSILSISTLALLFTCSAPGSTAPSYLYEFGGTWKYTSAANSSWYTTLTFTDTGYTFTSTIPPNIGSMTFSISSVDQTLDRFISERIAATGDYSGNAAFPLNQIWYEHYLLSGNTLKTGGLTSGYPDDIIVEAGNSYIKQ